MLIPTNSFLLLRVYTSVSNLVKIDKEMRPRECPQTDRHTHTRTDAKRFYYLSHAICYSYRADKKQTYIQYKIYYNIKYTLQKLKPSLVASCGLEMERIYSGKKVDR